MFIIFGMLYTNAILATCSIDTVMSLVIRTKLISGVRILWNTLINDFSQKEGGLAESFHN